MKTGANMAVCDCKTISSVCVCVCVCVCTCVCVCVCVCVGGWERLHPSPQLNMFHMLSSVSLYMDKHLWCVCGFWTDPWTVLTSFLPPLDRRAWELRYLSHFILLLCHFFHPLSQREEGGCSRQWRQQRVEDISYQQQENQPVSDPRTRQYKDKRVRRDTQMNPTETIRAKKGQFGVGWTFEVTFDISFVLFSES